MECGSLLPPRDCGGLPPPTECRKFALPEVPRDPRPMSWSHGPIHFNDADGIYIVTCGTYLKQHLYRVPADLDLFQSQLFAVANQHRIILHAWCVLINHYHLVLDARKDSLAQFFRHLHSIAAIELNRRHGTPGRKVWFQYYESGIVDEKSYFMRLKYVQENAVHHRVIANAMNYRWCSARWLADHASRGFVRAVSEASLNGIRIEDDF
jgi:putative transposase